MGKCKCISTGKVLASANDDFDWSVYDSGYIGGSRLVENKKVKTSSKRDKVYCHETYAQEFYDMLSDHAVGKPVVPKDGVSGTVYEISDIKPISKTEIALDTNVGMSMVVDLSKEKQYLETFNCKNIDEFVNAVNDPESSFKRELLESGVKAKVLRSGKISLWEGYKSTLEHEFFEQLQNKKANKYAYTGVIEGLNNGGFIINVSGIKCFLPGSLASTGIISDFNSMIGKSLTVMPVNYLPTSGFIMSHKKYIETILPDKITKELSINQQVNTKITGISKNGMFAQFKDCNGDWIFSGLYYRDYMSDEMESTFNKHSFKIGDEIRGYIYSINYAEDGKVRIVLSDKQAPVEKQEV